MLEFVFVLTQHCCSLIECLLFSLYVVLFWIGIHEICLVRRTSVTERKEYIMSIRRERRIVYQYVSTD